jgi:hypothetical protein
VEPSNPYPPGHPPSPTTRNRLPLILLAAGVGLVLIISAVITVALIARDNDSKATAPPTVTSPIDPAVDLAAVKQRLRKGDCIPELRSLDKLAIVPCDQPNGGKVIAIFSLPDGPFPGTEQARTTVDARCKRETGTSPIAPMAPTAGTWRLGDRVAACILLNLN